MYMHKKCCPVCKNEVKLVSNPYGLFKCDNCNFTDSESRLIEVLNSDAIEFELKKCRERIIELEAILAEESN